MFSDNTFYRLENLGVSPFNALHDNTQIIDLWFHMNDIMIDNRFVKKNKSCDMQGDNGGKWKSRATIRPHSQYMIYPCELVETK